jgi:hypothetical protein
MDLSYGDMILCIFKSIWFLFLNRPASAADCCVIVRLEGDAYQRMAIFFRFQALMPEFWGLRIRRRCR